MPVTADIEDAAMNHRILLPVALAIAILGLAGCAGSSDATTSSAAKSESRSNASPSGVVHMRPDRSLEITTLMSSSGGRATGVRIVSEEHRDYARILELTGPMKPG